MKRKNLLIVAGFAVLIVLVVLWPKSGTPGAKGKGASSTATVFTVKTAKVANQNLQAYIETNGDVEASSTIEVYPDVSGKIARIHVALGSRVTRGQLIAQVDPSKPGESYQLSPVYAPVAGTITSVPLDTGTTVTTSSSIAKIGATDDLQISTKINERDIAVIKTGLKATVTFEAYPGVDFPAHVIRVSPLVDSTSRTKQIYLGFDDTDDRIDAGMFAKIKLSTVLYTNRVAISEDAISTNFEKNFVYVVKADGATVEKREIKKGVAVDGVAEILSGLKSGEKIVVQGLQLLSDGALIKEVGTAAAADSTSGEKK